MKYPATGNDDFKRAPVGTHVGVCNMIADVGIQPGGMYGPKQKVYFRFELPNERIEYTKDGKTVEGPITIGTYHTASMNKKALMRAMLENWRGAKFTDEQASDFDIRNVLGKACLINVVEDTKDGKTYSNIANVMPLPKGTPVHQAENPLLYYGSDDESQFTKLPEWLQKKILGAVQPPEKFEPAGPDVGDGHDEFGDSVPF
jgi:hypothetical protein